MSTSRDDDRRGRRDYDERDDYADDRRLPRRGNHTLILIALLVGGGLIALVAIGALAWHSTARSAVVAKPPAPPPAAKYDYTPDQWNALIGKTPDEVMALLGRPNETIGENGADGEEWHYCDRVRNPVAKERGLGLGVLVFRGGKVAGVR